MTASQGESKVIYVEFDKAGEVSSPGFPTECCTPYSFTLQTILGETPGYIRMTFTDLDLPKESSLHVSRNIS